MRALLSGPLLALSFAACAAPREIVREVRPSAAPAAGPILVLPPRLCLERAPLTSRAPGRPGLEIASAVHEGLRARLPAPDAGTAPALSCREPTELGDDSLDPRSLTAPAEVLSVMRARAARSVLVTEIAVRLVCADPARYMHYAQTRGAARPEGTPCYEERVDLGAFVFDDAGRLVWAGTRRVRGEDDAPRAVEELLGRASLGLAPRCRLEGGRLDCT